MNDTCIVCFEEIISVLKWNCQTCTCKMHNDCFRRYAKQECPICKRINIEKDNFSMDYSLCRMGQTYNLVDSVVPYMNMWSQMECIRERHSLTLHKPYGVIIHCSTCGCTQSFNWIG